MDSAMPPVPPGIAAQQGPTPMQQYAQGASNAGSPNGQGGDPKQLLASMVDEWGKLTTKIAQVTGQTNPELIPILKQAVQAMAMFAGKIKAGSQSGAPSGGNQGTAGDTAPDAQGGAATGMPQ